jgi:hypothetical protein
VIEVACNPKHLGADIGLLSVLHTCLLRAYSPRTEPAAPSPGSLRCSGGRSGPRWIPMDICFFTFLPALSCPQSRLPWQVHRWTQATRCPRQAAVPQFPSGTGQARALPPVPARLSVEFPYPLQFTFANTCPQGTSRQVLLGDNIRPLGKMLTNRRRDEAKMATFEGCKLRSAEWTLPCSYRRRCNPSPQCGHRRIEQRRFSNEITLVPKGYLNGCRLLVPGARGRESTAQ